jgi:tRNA U34 5-carboxymethylaminomethyl modifying GTPase MnmE/TrmE
LWIQDATDGDSSAIDEELPDGIPIIVVRNKADLTQEVAGVDESDEQLIRLSAKSGDGLDELRTQIRRLAGHKNLGEITGATSSDDLLGMIFTEFCIGK